MLIEQCPDPSSLCEHTPYLFDHAGSANHRPFWVKSYKICRDS